MAVKKTCPDCGTDMVEGFVPEITNLGAVGLTWHPGKPKKKGEYLDVDFSSAIEISVFRCSDCGLLKRYAVGESES